MIGHQRGPRRLDRVQRSSVRQPEQEVRPGAPIATTHYRVRTDRVDRGGNVTLRHDSKLSISGSGARSPGHPSSSMSLTSIFGS
jgi:hypothetical protein